MCNKFIVFCLALFVAGFCVPVSAESEITLGTPLKIDIVLGSQQPKPGWLPWSFQAGWPGPTIETFDFWEIHPPEILPPIAQLEGYRKNLPAGGIARDRSGGWAGVNRTGDISPTGMGFGLNYLKLTIGYLDPYTSYKFYLWSFEKREIWTASSDNPDSKWGVWSTTNPTDWLNANGYSGNNGEPNGYGPITPVPNPLVNPICPQDLPLLSRHKAEELL